MSEPTSNEIRVRASALSGHVEASMYEAMQDRAEAAEARAAEAEEKQGELIEWLRERFKYEDDCISTPGGTTHPERAFGRRMAYGAALHYLDVQPPPVSTPKHPQDER